MPFKSRQQWKWCFATGQEFCHRWAHETQGKPVDRYRDLPKKVRSKSPKVRSK